MRLSDRGRRDGSRKWRAPLGEQTVVSDVSDERPSVKDYLDFRFKAEREYLETRIKSDHDLVGERWRSDDEERKEFRTYMERRLSDLNGEAGRLKTILDASVPKTTFDAYVSTQRDKDDARAKSQREHFDAYEKAQADAFKKYTDDITAKLSAINVRIATFVGGATVFLTMLQLWLSYGKK